MNPKTTMEPTDIFRFRRTEPKSVSARGNAVYILDHTPLIDAEAMKNPPKVRLRQDGVVGLGVSTRYAAAQQEPLVFAPLADRSVREAPRLPIGSNE